MPDNVIHELQQPLTLINVSDVTEEEHEKVRNSGTTATSTTCRGWPLAQAMLSPMAGASTPHPAATMVGAGATGAGAVLPPVIPSGEAREDCHGSLLRSCSLSCGTHLSQNGYQWRT